LPLRASTRPLRASISIRCRDRLNEGRLDHYKGNDQKRGATLKRLFLDAGCDGEHLSEQPVEESKLPNIICVLTGSSGRVIIAGAHFAHVRAGDGVVDNWSGASLLPSLYQAVKIVPRKHTCIFIGFTDEEKGEVGSRFYAQHMTKDEVASADAMVSMDALGLAPPEVWAGHSDQRLTGALVLIAKKLNVPVTAVNVVKLEALIRFSFPSAKSPASRFTL
jgi:Zn-dependent M28 family amino/carboxypeptidase